MSDLENERGNKAITTGTSGAMVMKVLLFFFTSQRLFTPSSSIIKTSLNRSSTFFYCIKNREFCCT